MNLLPDYVHLPSCPICGERCVSYDVDVTALTTQETFGFSCGGAVARKAPLKPARKRTLKDEPSRGSWTKWGFMLPCRNATDIAISYIERDTP